MEVFGSYAKEFEFTLNTSDKSWDSKIRVLESESGNKVEDTFERE